MRSKICIILVLACYFSAFSQEDFKVTSSNRNALVVQYTPHVDTSHIKINNQTFIKMVLNEGYVAKPDERGMPAVPQANATIGVPAKNGNSIKVLSSNYYEIDGKVSPKPKIYKQNNMSSFEYGVSKNYNNFTNSDLASLGNFGILRGIPTSSVILSPIQFYPERNTIRVYTKIIFQVLFSPRQAAANNKSDNFLTGMLLNYIVAKNWSEASVNRAGLKKTKGTFSSVLATGKWYRFDCSKDGMYKITKSMLTDYGIDASTVDPRTIKIYNNGGKTPPENPTSARPKDLVQNAIMVVGEDDGRFDDGDYILFYGHGTDFWSFDSTSNSIKRSFNVYSNHNYYWITSGGDNGKRMSSEPSLNEKNAYNQTFTNAYVDNDSDEINLMGSGTIFLGDVFTPSTLSRTYTNKLDNRLAQYPINYKFRVVNASIGTVEFGIYENATNLVTTYINGKGTGSEDFNDGVSLESSTTFNGNLPDNRSLLKFQFTFGSGSDQAYLDYFEINYKKELKAVNDYLEFYSEDTTATIQYDLNDFSSTNIEVFDVTDFADVRQISNPVIQSGGEFKFEASQMDSSVSKYVAIGSDNFYTPSNPVQVDNQNIHGISGGAKFIIITNKAFADQANRLKDYRTNQAKIRIPSIVVDVDQIYNEFSCGSVDVTGIRDFIKYAYDNWDIKPEYVLLFGDGNYDYKNIEGKNIDFIPTYETNSLDEIYSYPMDDYYIRVDGDDNVDDLAIGRITCQTDDEAKDIVDKIISYENSTDKDIWRNLITLVADDGYTTDGYEGNYHTAQSEDLANSFIPKSYDLDKIYLAQYPVVITGSGRRFPEVNQAIIDAINQGTVIVNFIGHGDPSEWTHERVWENSTTIPQLHNNRLFFLAAATCDFGHFDLTTAQSGAELLLAKQGSGSIGAFCSTRAVYSGSNAALNQEFYSYLLSSNRDTLNLPITVGKAYFYAKVQSSGDRQNDEKFCLLGDPTLRLDIPEYSANISSVDGTNLTSDSTVQIKALSNTKIEGDILKPDQTKWRDFNGQGILTVFDSKRTVPLPQLMNYPINVTGGIIYRGKVSITNGSFSTNFVVPKDISYQNQNGKINIYFYNNNSDGTGYSNQIIVGGTDSTAVNDGKGPVMDIYFDKNKDENSYLVTPNSTLYVSLTDETGINTTGTGVGHKLEGILNDNKNNPINFTNYFVGNIDAGGKSGEIVYPLTDLDPGDYNIKVTAWDVYNNSSSEEKYFSIVGNNELVVKDVYNYPDPFVSSTTFTFQQNLNSPINVKIAVYTIAGRKIKEIQKNNVDEKFVTVPWDGRDQYGDILANGVYLYKLTVKTIDGKYTKSELGKLAIIR
jgi:hypothetical protein